MATVPTSATAGLSAGATAGIGAVGNAINAYTDRRGSESMNRLRLEQTRRQIQFEQEERARQAQAREAEYARQKQAQDRQYALSNQEVERQQMYAQANAGLFDNSLGLLQRPAEMAIGDASSQIAQLYRDYLSRPSAVANVAPEATGVTAEREANMRAQASDEVSGEAGRLAALQGFSQYMADNGRTMANNESLAGMFNNFARGSAGASRFEIEAAGAGGRGPDMFIPRNFIKSPIIERQPSQLGDMFVGLATAYGNRPQTPPATQYPLLPEGYQAPGGYGVRMPRTGGDYGVRVPADLGIGGSR
jgi:hypothetical protein